MDVAQLNSFLAVAEELHFGRAALRLRIAQPALSRTIQQLERQLGVRLFDRSTRRVTLTPGGRALQAAAPPVLDALRRAEAAARSASGGTSGLVRVAFAGVSTAHLVAQAARAVRVAHPGIELQLSSQQFAQPALRSLQRGSTDLALGRFDLVPPDLDAQVVMDDALAVAVPSTHHLADATEVSMADLVAEQFVSLSPLEGAVLPDRLRRLAGVAGFLPDVVQIAPDTQTALALVGAGVGCHLTLTSVAAADTSPHVRFLVLTDDAPDVHLRMAWRRADDGDAALRVARSAVVSAGQDAVQVTGVLS